jgi:hypothetical protein
MPFEKTCSGRDFGLLRTGGWPGYGEEPKVGGVVWRKRCSVARGAH